MKNIILTLIICLWGVSAAAQIRMKQIHFPNPDSSTIENIIFDKNNGMYLFRYKQPILFTKDDFIKSKEIKEIFAEYLYYGKHACFNNDNELIFAQIGERYPRNHPNMRDTITICKTDFIKIDTLKVLIFQNYQRLLKDIKLCFKHDTLCLFFKYTSDFPGKNNEASMIKLFNNKFDEIYSLGISKGYGTLDLMTGIGVSNNNNLYFYFENSLILYRNQFVSWDSAFKKIAYGSKITCELTDSNIVIYPKGQWESLSLFVEPSTFLNLHLDTNKKFQEIAGYRSEVVYAKADKIGNIYFGTDNGAVDGHTFWYFNKADFSLQNITEFEFGYVHISNKNEVYIHPSKGLYKVENPTNVEYQIPTATISPNPVTDYLTINLNDEIFSYNIFDNLGKTILSGDNKNTIDVSYLPAGVFYLSIITKNGKMYKTKKFVKI